MKIERDMKLSFDLTIEKILELIKEDILNVKKNRQNKAYRIHIESKVYTVT